MNSVGWAAARPNAGQRRVALRTLAAVVLFASVGGAVACGNSAANTVYLTVDISATDAPGTTRVVRGSPTWMSNCDVNQIQPLEVSLQSVGLRPVSSIEYEGKRYVTYELGPTSPLFFFPVHVKTSDPGVTGGYERIPAAEGSVTRVDAVVGTSNQVMTYPHLGVVVRAGMQSLAQTELGTEVIQHTRFPHSIRHTVFATVNVEQPTCALSDTGFTLADISADVLAAVGSSSRAETVQVKLQCSTAGVPVQLTLTDANAPAATGSLLEPTASATAQGVQVELLRNDVPVVLGQQWNHGMSSAGAQNIELQARYTRVGGAFRTGVVEGQATLTATYR